MPIESKEESTLNKSFDNYQKIISKKLPHKFSYLGSWLLKKSDMLLYESNSHKYDITKTKKTYWKFKKGTIIKVDFGVNLGSEMSQIHFAVVISKNDNIYNDAITVMPLTSKNTKTSINLGNLVVGDSLEKLEKKLTSLSLESEMSDKDNANDMLKIKQVINKYRPYLKETYACPNLITTISKSRILRPINEYDIIGRRVCSDEILSKIDQLICIALIGKKNDLTNKD